MSRAVIVCGAKIKDYEWVSSFFKEGDFFIYCDSGLIHEDRFLSATDTRASLIVGDFDSHEKPSDRNDVEIIILPREKDDTDSVYAVKEAINRGFTEVLMIGAIGDRLDHSLVNAYILQFMYERGVKAEIVDDTSVMSLVCKDKPGYIETCFEYFSLITLNGEAKGVTIKNAKFPLCNDVIKPEYQFATSNEVIGEEPAEVTVEEGVLLLMKVRAGY